MKLFGLVGYPLSHSFSQAWFTRKFVELGLTDHVYRNFPIERIQDFPEIVLSFPDLCGINVTIPYKEEIIPYLDRLSPEAEAIGAVNTICLRDGLLEGHNTDWIGFKKSLSTLLATSEPLPSAIVLGSGGAAKAVRYALKTMDISYITVSRRQAEDSVLYEDLTDQTIAESLLIIHTTPIGMFPFAGLAPAINFQAIGEQHLLYDLIYNPPKTVFLTKGEDRGARTQNGLDMLRFQAQEAWELWKKL